MSGARMVAGLAWTVYHLPTLAYLNERSPLTMLSRAMPMCMNVTYKRRRKVVS